MSHVSRAVMVFGFGTVMAARLVAESSATVPFALEGRGGVIVSATVAGRGPFRLLVDTGSNRSALSETAIRTVGGRLVARTEVVSSAGSGWRNVAEVGPVIVGPATQPRVLATVLPSEEVRTLGTGIDGILGQDFLRMFNYTIDYRQRQMFWNVDIASVTDANEIRLALRPDEGRFLVELPQGKGVDHIVRFVPDSGADMIVLFERAGEPPLAIVRPDLSGSVLGLAGRRNAAFGSIAALRVGTEIWRNCPAAVLARRDDVPHVDGLLPLRLFGRVSFFPNDRLLVVRR